MRYKQDKKRGKEARKRSNDNCLTKDTTINFEKLHAKHLGLSLAGLLRCAGGITTP
jgi:hypothetical protein